MNCLEKNYLSLKQFGLIPIQGSGVDIDWHGVGVLWQCCHSQRLLDTIADIECSPGRVSQSHVEIDRRKEGSASFPQPQKLVILHLSFSGALASVSWLVPSIVKTVRKQIKAPTAAWTLADTNADGFFHVAPSCYLKLALSHLGYLLC